MNNSRVEHDCVGHIGRFRVRHDVLHQTPWEDLKTFFEPFVILRAEHRPVEEAYFYTAYSEVFEEVEAGEKIPWYRVEMTFRQKRDGTSTPTLQAEKLDNSDPHNLEGP